MIKTILSLVKSLKHHGHVDYANEVFKLAKKLSLTKCVAVFKHPIKSSNGVHSYFDYKVSSPEQRMAAIPHILSKKYDQVWFLNKNYQLPSQSKILAAKLLEEKILGNITCECYIDEK
jgi:hypothetical protein